MTSQKKRSAVPSGKFEEELGKVVASCLAMEDVETRFKLALQYISKGGLIAQHPGASPPSNEVLLEYYACVYFTSLLVQPLTWRARSHVSGRLYKQANYGDCTEPQPWKVQLERYYKWCCCQMQITLKPDVTHLQASLELKTRHEQSSCDARICGPTDC